MGRRGFKTMKVPLTESNVVVYVSPRMSNALAEVTASMTLYQGVRLTQILEVLYHQGMKDGARMAFESLYSHVRQAMREVPHKRPGRPKKH